jgi:thymidylate kinase
MEIKRGKLIVLESVDGAGKGTVVEALKKEFQNRQDILFTREPGGHSFRRRCAKNFT